MNEGARVSRLWSRLGPGILLAATAIGASHLVMAPQAGAIYGVSLLWLIPLSHLLKYPAFEFGPRYAAATGKSLLAAYARAPGGKNWALWVFLVSTVLQGAGVLAGVVGIAAAVLAAYTGGRLQVPVLGGVVIAVVLVLLAAGGFRWLDSLNKTMMAVLTLTTILVAFVQLPPAGTLRGLLVPSVPVGSVPLIAAVLGWMPTGIDVSVWHSLWTLEKEKVLARQRRSGHEAGVHERLASALSDMRIGYGLSVVVAFVFVILGATYLGDRAAELAGARFPSALASVYADNLGAWMYHLFFVAAFFAMFSTSYTVLDGFSRSFCETLPRIDPRLSVHKRRLYWGFALGSGALAAGTLATVGNPVTLVLVVGVISLCFAPVLYALNTWAVVSGIDDEQLRPGRWTLAIAFVGIVAMAVTSGLYAWVKLSG